MTFLELAKKRRSTRKYSAKPVSREVVEKCLEAARLAPSACNSQPWSFIVIDNEKDKNSLAEAAFSGIHSMNTFAKKAPVLIVIVTEQSVYAAKVGGYLKGVQYSLIDVGIACEHLCLAAAEEGVGTCWLGWFNEKAVKKILGLPDNKKIDVVISMGYPENEEPREKIRKTLDNQAILAPVNPRMRNLTGTGFFISSKIGKAIKDYNLIEDGDKLLVAVSGGKDSVSLLKMLLERKKWAPVKFDIIAAHIETDFRCGSCVHKKDPHKPF